MEDVQTVNTGGSDQFQNIGSTGSFNANAAMCYFANALKVCSTINQNSGQLMNQLGLSSLSDAVAIQELGKDVSKKDPAELYIKIMAIKNAHPSLSKGGVFSRYVSDATMLAHESVKQTLEKSFEAGFRWGFMYDSHNLGEYESDACYCSYNFFHPHEWHWQKIDADENTETGVQNGWESNYRSSKDYGAPGTNEKSDITVGNSVAYKDASGNSQTVDVSKLLDNGDGAVATQGNVLYGAANCIRDGFQNAQNYMTTKLGVYASDFKSDFNDVFKGLGFYGDQGSGLSLTVCQGWLQGACNGHVDMFSRAVGMYRSSESITGGSLGNFRWCVTYAMALNMMREDTNGFNAFNSGITGTSSSYEFQYADLAVDSDHNTEWYSHCHTNAPFAAYWGDRLCDTRILGDCLNALMPNEGFTSSSVSEKMARNAYDTKGIEYGGWNWWNPRLPDNRSGASEITQNFHADGTGGYTSVERKPFNAVSENMMFDSTASTQYSNKSALMKGNTQYMDIADTTDYCVSIDASAAKNAGGDLSYQYQAKQLVETAGKDNDNQAFQLYSGQQGREKDKSFYDDEIATSIGGLGDLADSIGEDAIGESVV